MPLPAFATFSANVLIVKVAVAVLSAVIETVQVAPFTESQPVQLVKVESTSGAAVSVTEVLMM